jgi:AcrR family transcriptional regulator
MPRPRSDIRPRIVEAARARFLAEGVDGASLREIARDAGTNIGMVVYYFATKDDLLLSVIEDVYADIVRDLKQILGAGGSARDRLRLAFVRLGNTSDLELDVIRLIAREALSSSTRLQRILGRFMKGHVPLLIETIAEGMRDGEFDVAIPAPFVFMAIIGIGGLPQLIRRAAARSLPFFSALPRTEALAQTSIDVLFRAVGPPTANKGKPRVARKRAPRRDA